MTETQQPAASAWPGGISVITLFVEDLKSTKAFYETVFGLQIVFEDKYSAVFRFSNIIINLLDSTAAPELIAPARVASPEAGTRMQFTIDVEDVDEMCEELTGRGVEILIGPMNRPWGIRTAASQDPAGHIWEIAHNLPR
jgi:catechol 2,3-dioxygenase-like lactoylglutathione lyase family enzyme